MPNDGYDVFLCDTAASREINYRIRYQVYCLEKNYEHASHYPARMETDEFDDRSAHFIARECASGGWVAACRLIIAPLEQLPLSGICAIENSRYRDLERTAEISRLCAVASPRSGQPVILGRLLEAIYQYSQRHLLEHLFSLHSLSMNRVVKTLGFSPEPIGSECEFRGRRRVYHTVIRGRQGSQGEIGEPSYRRYSEQAGLEPQEERGRDLPARDAGAPLQ